MAAIVFGFRRFLLHCFLCLSLAFWGGYSSKQDVSNIMESELKNSSRESFANGTIDTVQSSNSTKNPGSSNLKIATKKISRKNFPVNTCSLLGHLIEPVKHQKVKAARYNTTNKRNGPLWVCRTFNTTRQSVIILDNKDSLLDLLEEINKTMSCAVVLFYARWCYFSSTLAPLYNAIGRAFEGIPIVALDAYTHNSLNNRYGIVGVPTIVIFQESRPVARFNRSRTLNELVEFIHENTGMKYNTSIEIIPEDYAGPLPSSPSDEPNYYLIASLVFVVTVAFVVLWRLQYIQIIVNHLPSWSTVKRTFGLKEREKEE